jgi:hypothetical protein
VSAARAVLVAALVGGSLLGGATAGAQEDEQWKVGYPHIEFGIDVGVILWNHVDRNVVRPGGTVDARISWDYKYWAPMIALGFRGNGIDYDALAGAPTLAGRQTLTNIFFALGVRFVYPNRSRVSPLLDGWFDLNWWHLNETTVVCDPTIWYCRGYSNFRFTPGFHGRLGIQIRLTPSADLEIGFGAGYTFQGQFFTSNESWLEPSIGFTYSFPPGYQDRTSMHNF